ncbi:uncharacterized protein LOC129762525 isoform X2 [Toxorhynchites rutilus septentrionalis]|uniref:uncharacterized protein LOC129762525 isoform X2 n=1 Tax=Toxorhynchites rutilus septentrionalis TaxID=329112 RepID=UPI002479FE87|nr:uncharacterized protein LOC129762525 isoform X2 [Toxorhynchites rutilus septentrionalis]
MSAKEQRNQIRRKKRHLTEQLSQHEKEENPTEAGVEGFVFPLTSETEVEELEQAVQSDSSIRDQYVTFLQNCKPSRLDVAYVFPDLFSDNALLGYNYYGKTNRSNMKKKAMRDYVIFNDCMIDAWHSHGVNEVRLKATIVKIIARLNHKLRTRGYRKKNTTETLQYETLDELYSME